MALIQVQRQDARRTLEKLIETHRRTVKNIDEGMRFFKHGTDITARLRVRCLFEIEQCRMVDGALDSMKEGDIQRAAALCEKVQEHILNVD